MKSVEFKYDKNGNKCLSVKFQGFRAFSIQTLGNLPIAHKATFDSVDVAEFVKIKAEVLAYLSKHGTKRQKIIAGL
mgnify:FL=1